MPEIIPFFGGVSTGIIKEVCFPTNYCLLIASDLHSTIMLIFLDFHPRPLGKNSMFILEIPHHKQTDNTRNDIGKQEYL